MGNTYMSPKDICEAMCVALAECLKATEVKDGDLDAALFRAMDDMRAKIRIRFKSDTWQN